MKFVSLFSGSSGNSLFVSEKQTRLLIDAGKNGKQIEKNLLEVGEDPASLSGILITHEHIDHIAGAGVLSRRYNLPIYANENTWEAMAPKLGKIKEENRRVFENCKPFVIGDLEIEAIETSHDAVDSVGFTLSSGMKRVSMATDTGYLTDGVIKKLPGSDLVYLESNHDVGMLEAGSYPYYLKRRIRGSMGHLSNEVASEFSLDLAKSGVENLILGHLSSENNLPQLAHQSCACVLMQEKIIPGRDLILEVAPRSTPGSVFNL